MAFSLETDIAEGKCALTEYGIVAPDFTATEMTEDMAASETGRQRLRDIPLGRFGRASEVAAAVVFLLTDASSLFLGQTLNPNGGGFMP